MKHTKGKLAARSKKASVPVKKRKAINFAELREEITEMVKGRAVSLVDTMITEADKGNLAAMKYLFEMISLFLRQRTKKNQWARAFWQRR